MNLAVVKFAKRNTFIIDPDGKIARVFTDVNPNKHSAEVLAVLASLQPAPQQKSR
jgi:peroxiredoxin Q/BCP